MSIEPEQEFRDLEQLARLTPQDQQALVDLVHKHALELDAAQQEAALHRTNIEVLLAGASEREAELLNVVRAREDRINELSKELTRAIHGVDAIPEG